MTTRQLAKPWGHPSRSRGRRAERSQSDITSHIATIRTALGCELTYALYPNAASEVVEERLCESRATRSRVKHSMALEDQSTGREHLEREIAELRRKLMEANVHGCGNETMRFEYAPAPRHRSGRGQRAYPAHLTLQRELNEYEESNISRRPHGCSRDAAGPTG